MNQIKIGKFIAQLRKEKNMTQEVLAKKLNVNNKSISRWENGNSMPDLSLLKPLSYELGVSINELLSGEKISTDKNNYQEKFEENVIKTIQHYNQNKTKALITIGYLLSFSSFFAASIIGIVDGATFEAKTFLLIGGILAIITGIYYLYHYYTKN